MSDSDHCKSSDRQSPRDWQRREFLLAAGALPLAAATAGLVGAGQAQGLPQIRIGKNTISRLVCGSNPFHAGSHLSVFVNKEMKDYYTPEQILKTVRRCEEAGITAWQGGLGPQFDLYHRYLAEGGKMKFMVIDNNKDHLPELVKGGCIGVAHHGEATDALFKQGKFDQVGEFLKHVRQSGMAVGVSTHMPAVVDEIESRGWDLDYYMCCVYERHRSEADLLKLLGHVPLPVGEVYLKSDPPRMFKAIRGTKRTCLAFKILAAGRLSENPHWVEQAFRETFTSIKPGDGAIIGLYDRYSNQAAEDAAMVRKFS
jgi:hypothetical protein